MDIHEVGETFFAATDAKLHGGMCKTLSEIYCKVLGIFPAIEAARPRSKSGIQALCSLHIALEKTKNALQHCAECSKLYLAITGDSVLLKFEKAASALKDGLTRVEDIVPQSIGSQILEIISEIEGTEFVLDSSEKQVGEELIALLQQGRKFNSNSNDMNELESFHQAASRLAITSSRAALTERRALKKIVDRARMEDDKRKESIVAYLLHLMRKYSKLFRSELSNDNDSQGSAPCSPTVQSSLEDGVGMGDNVNAFDRQFAKQGSFNFKTHNRRSWQMTLPPEELRCPISLQLMYDPVIISSGQTYERLCIEKWFSDGHNTCPKTQQQLSHLALTPNYCVKGLIASWCEQNGVPLPEAPPESLDLNYWRLVLSECESTNSKSMDNITSCKVKGVKVVPVEDSCIVEEVEGNDADVCEEEEEIEVNIFERCENFLDVLREGEDLREKCKVVEHIRHLLKDDEETRLFMGANGFIEPLMHFLETAVLARDEVAQQTGAMALFNLAVNNDRNKEMILASGVIGLLEEMISSSNAHESATALYLNLSCLEEAKPIIGSSKAISFLIQCLGPNIGLQCKLDALHALYNLSTNPSCIQSLLSAGIISALLSLLMDAGEHSWMEKSIAVLMNLASSKSGRDEIISTTGVISALSTTLDTGEPIEQEQAVSCLLILCNKDNRCSQMVLQEGVIPSLVSISVNGTIRGKEKAQKLLMLFREQRQRDPSPVKSHHPQHHSQPLSELNNGSVDAPEFTTLSKSASRRKLVKPFSFLWKSKSVSYQC